MEDQLKRLREEQARLEAACNLNVMHQARILTESHASNVNAIAAAATPHHTITQPPEPSTLPSDRPNFARPLTASSAERPAPARAAAPTPRPAAAAAPAPIVALDIPLELRSSSGAGPVAARPSTGRGARPSSARPRAASTPRERPRSAPAQPKTAAAKPAEPLHPWKRAPKAPPPFKSVGKPILNIDALAQMAREKREAAEAPKVGEVKAREVPKHVLEPRFAQMKAKWTGPERAASIAERAKASLENSKLPPRMELSKDKDEEKRLRRLADPEPQGSFQPFKAREIPEAVKQSMWEEMQMRDAARSAKTAAEAERLLRMSSLPQRMETSLRESRAAKERDLERIRREAEAEHTFRPQPAREVPDFSRPFKPTPKPLPPPTKPFRMARGSPDEVEQQKKKELERIVKDMARDETIMPEPRWPYKSTRCPIHPTPPPNFEKMHKRMPKTGTTLAAELRNSARAMERLQAQIKKERDAAEKQERIDAQRERTQKVSKALGFPSAEAKKAMEKADREKRAKKFKQQLKEMQESFDNQLAEMRDRIEKRPFLFQQQTIDTKIYDEKQAAYAKFDAALKKQGLTDVFAN